MFAGHDRPTHGLGQEVFEMSGVGSGRVGLGWVKKS